MNRRSNILGLILLILLAQAAVYYLVKDPEIFGNPIDAAMVLGMVVACLAGYAVRQAKRS